MAPKKEKSKVVSDSESIVYVDDDSGAETDSGSGSGSDSYSGLRIGAGPSKDLSIEEIGTNGDNIGDKSMDVTMPGPIKDVLPTLYIPKSSRITEWIIFTVHDRKDKSRWYISTKSRQYPDGKWKVEEPKEVFAKNLGKKNQRLPIDQAKSEAQSKYEEKVNKGRAMTSAKSAQKIIDGENSGTGDRYSMHPMLGKDIEQAKKTKNGKDDIRTFEEHRLHYPVYVQKKLDGVHVLVFWDATKEKVILMSRANLIYKPFTAIEDALEPWFRKHPNIILDGELYSHDDWSFQALAGIAKKEKVDKMTAEQKNLLHKIIVYLFDYIDLDNQELNYTERMDRANDELQPFLKKLEDKQKFIPVEILDYHEANNRREIDKVYNEFIKDGFEGAMIRNDMPYILSKRTSDRLFKYKPRFDAEYKVIDYVEGRGKFAGTMIWIAETKDHQQFKVTPDGELSLRKKIFNELQTPAGKKKYLNKMYTIRFLSYSEDQIPTKANIDTPPVNKHIAD